MMADILMMVLLVLTLPSTLFLLYLYIRIGLSADFSARVEAWTWKS